MSKSAFLRVRIEPELKQRASQMLLKAGVSTDHAITIFLREVVRRDGLPFDVRVRTATAIANGELEAARHETFHDGTKEIFNGVVRSGTKRKNKHSPVARGHHNTHQMPSKARH
jgi:DNA-damage-inducible protein J